MVLLPPLSQLLVILLYFLLEKGLSFWPGEKKPPQPCARCYARTGDNVPVLGDRKTVCIIIMSVVNLGFFKANVGGEKSVWLQFKVMVITASLALAGKSGTL